MRLTEVPQLETLLGRPDQLLAPRDAGGTERDEIIPLRREQLGAVQGEQRVTLLYRLPGLVHEQLFDVRVVLEHHLADLRLVHLDAAGRPQGDGQRSSLDPGVDDADQLLPLRCELDGLRPAFARRHRPARLDRVALVRRRYLQTQLGVRVSGSVDSEGECPVAQHRERIRDPVPSAALRLDVAAAFHLGHGAHRGHVVDEPDLCAVDALALRIHQLDPQDVVAGHRRVGIELDTHQHVTGVQRTRTVLLRAGTEKDQRRDANDALHGLPPLIARVPDPPRPPAAVRRGAVRTSRSASPDLARACAARARCRGP